MTSCALRIAEVIATRADQSGAVATVAAGAGDQRTHRDDQLPARPARAADPQVALDGDPGLLSTSVYQGLTVTVSIHSREGGPCGGAKASPALSVVVPGARAVTVACKVPSVAVYVVPTVATAGLELTGTVHRCPPVTVNVTVIVPPMRTHTARSGLSLPG